MSYVRIYPTSQPWELVVIGDTQLSFNSDDPPRSEYQNHLSDSIAWIVANKDARNIKMVLHMGDLTGQDTTTYRSAAQQFSDALSIMGALTDAGIPWMVCPGNHDANNPTTGDYTNWKTYFPYTYFAAIQPSTWGGYCATDEVGTWRRFSAGGQNYVVVALHHYPNHDADFDWAVGIFDTYPDDVGILITHAYMKYDDVEVTYETSLWDHVVQQTAANNIRIILNGNWTNVYQNSRVNGAVTVYQMLYGHDPHDTHAATGEAIRILRFTPATNTVTVTTYCADEAAWRTGADANFEWNLDA